MTHLRVAILASGLLLASIAAAEPACRTRVLVEPERAFVGQQIVYRLQIFRQSDVESVRFAEDLAFPSFRVEWLPGQSPDPAIAGIGDHAIVFEERRALFPARAGILAIPAARLACQTDAATIEAEVPATRVEARALPTAATPPGFAGLVGRVDVQANLGAPRIALGHSLALVVSVRGEANVWDALAPLDPARDLAGLDVEVFPRPPSLEREVGRRFGAQRSFAYELVPRALGTFTIPALRVPYFDPEQERYAIAETQPLHFTVEAAESAASGALQPASSVENREPGSSAPRSGAGFAALALVAIFVVAAMAIRRVIRQREPRRAAAALLAEASDAAARGDRPATLRALSGALRAALETRLPGAHALAAEEIAARGDTVVRGAAALLQDLERARFAAPAGNARALDVERVRALIDSL